MTDCTCRKTVARLPWGPAVPRDARAGQPVSAHLVAVPPPRPTRATAFTDLPATLQSSTRPAQCSGEPSGVLPARWARIGGLHGAASCANVVDLEGLLVATAAADDSRLFDVAASWLAVHHMFVFGRRLSGMAGALAKARMPTAARLGAILDQAWMMALALPDDLRVRPENLATARERCRRGKADAARERGERPRRGDGTDRRVPTPEPVQPVEWVVKHVPELRVRALVGATLEAEILVAALANCSGAPDNDIGAVPMPNVGAIARHAGVSYAGAHGAANRLVRRGLLVRQVERGQVVLRPSLMACAVLGWHEHAATHS